MISITLNIDGISTVSLPLRQAKVLYNELRQIFEENYGIASSFQGIPGVVGGIGSQLQQAQQQFPNDLERAYAKKGTSI